MSDSTECSPDLLDVDSLGEETGYKPLESISETRTAVVYAVCATFGDEWEKKVVRCIVREKKEAGEKSSGRGMIQYLTERP